MYRGLVLLLALVASTNGKVVPVPEQFSGRISGGVDATIESVPYQVAVIADNLCGGSILSPRVVITAAHCVENSNETYSVQYGSNEYSEGKNVEIARIELHEGYNTLTNENDVAIIHLAEDIEFGPNAKPIALANKSPAPGTVAVASGWGGTREGPPTFLQKVNLQIIDHAVCEKQLRPDGINLGESALCAGNYGGNETICPGDSGGPLVANNELVGISSWCLAKSEHGICNGSGDPSFFANVTFLRQWIDSKMKQD